jgi:hypothetical protein
VLEVAEVVAVLEVVVAVVAAVYKNTLNFFLHN